MLLLFIMVAVMIISVVISIILARAIITLEERFSRKRKEGNYVRRKNQNP